MNENINKKQTLIKHSALIQMSHKDITAVQQKIYNLLIYVARETLKQQNTVVFTMPLIEVNKYLNVDIRNVEFLKEQIRKLVNTTVEYNILDKDKEEWGIFALLAGAKFVKKEDKTYIQYQLPFQIQSALKSNSIYAKLNLRILKGLKSKYAIILYELAKDYINTGIPELSIEDFRKLFGIEGKYKNFAEIQRYVLKQAIDEINKNKQIDFYISYKLRKKGRKYTHIKFILKRKAQKQQQKQVQQQKIRGVINTKQNTQQQVQQMDRKKQVELGKKLVRMLAKGITNGLVDIESVLINLSVEYGRDVLAYSLGRIRNDTNILKQLRLAGSESAVEEILDMQCRYIVENVKKEEIYAYVNYMIKKYIEGKNENQRATTQKTE